MIKELKLSNLLFLAAVSFAVVYFMHSIPANRTSTFVYDEVVVHAKPADIAVLPVVPSQIAPMPLNPPHIIYSVAPTYPQTALEKGIRGVAIVEANISPAGMPQALRIKSSSGNAELDNAALTAVSKWKFSPATQNGQGVTSVFEVPVRFEWRSKV